MIYIKALFLAFMINLPSYGHDCDCPKNMEPKSWLQSRGSEPLIPPLSRVEAFEVKNTKVFLATMKLQQSSYLVLSNKELMIFLDHTPIAPKESKPYLIRGVTESLAGNKMNVVSDSKNNLSVSAFAMGAGGHWSYVPLVVFLSEAPRNVFVSTRGAM